jgi:predicted nucleic acid-binding protein
VAAALVERIHRHAILVPTVPSHFQYPRDPDDEHILNLAVEVGARYIVSRDKDLLDLMADRPEGLDFRLRFPQLLVLDPVALLRDLALLSKPETDQE